MPAGAQGAWEWVASQARPRWVDRGPRFLEPSDRPEKARRFYTGEFILDMWTDPANPRPMGLLLTDGAATWYADYDASPDWTESAPASFAALEGKAPLVFFWNGAALQFHAFLRHLAPVFARQGWELYPMATNTDIRAVKLRLGKREWWLCDAGAATGCDGMERGAFLHSFGWGTASGEPATVGLYRAMAGFQSVSLACFGVSLRPTIGLLAVKAAQRYLPAEPRWYRPSALLAAVCRAGGAYRGGYQYAVPYKGDGWRIDCNKAYQWALSLPLPAASAFGKCEKDGIERPGVYLTRVAGRGHLPAYLAAWAPDTPHFRKRNIWTLDGLAFLPSVEYAGLRALGYQVEPLWGFVFTDHVSLTPFTDRLAAIQAEYPRGTAQHQIAKTLANSLYGKLAAPPERTDVVYSAQAPDDTWWPYVTVRNEVIEGLWARPTVRQSATQHPDAAAVVTARVRANTYGVVGDLAYRGCRVVHVDTDGAILASSPDGYVGTQAITPGSWRAVASCVPTVVNGPKCYAIGGEAFAPGLSHPDPAWLELARSGRSVAVARQVLRAPWTGGDMLTRQPYTIRPLSAPPESE